MRKRRLFNTIIPILFIFLFILILWLNNLDIKTGDNIYGEIISTGIVSTPIYNSHRKSSIQVSVKLSNNINIISYIPVFNLPKTGDEIYFSIQKNHLSERNKYIPIKINGENIINP